MSWYSKLLTKFHDGRTRTNLWQSVCWHINICHDGFLTCGERVRSGDVDEALRGAERCLETQHSSFIDNKTRQESHNARIKAKDQMSYSQIRLSVKFIEEKWMEATNLPRRRAEMSQRTKSFSYQVCWNGIWFPNVLKWIAHFARWILRLTCRKLTEIYFLSISPTAAGITAPTSGVFLPLKSSDICSNVTHSTPSCLLMWSIILRGLAIVD